MKNGNFKQRLDRYIKGREFPTTLLTVAVITLVVFINLVITSLSSIVPLYLYTPEEDDLSISSASDMLFKSYIDKGIKVNVTFCSYEDVVSNHATGKFVYQTAKEFEKRYPGFINLRFINAITQLDSEGKSVSDELKVYLDGGNNSINDTSVIFSTDTSFRVLTDYTGTGYVDFYTLDSSYSITSYNGEEMFASSVLWTLNENHGTAYMTVGHGESANGTLFNILTAAGYKVKEINLRKSDVPDDAELLIISNPISDFERGAVGSTVITEYDRLSSYRNRGGSFMVMLDPTAKPLNVLEGFVLEFGISVRKNETGETMMVKDSDNAITTDGFTLVANYSDSDIAKEMKNVITLRSGDDDGRVILRNMSALTLTSKAHLEVSPLLVASSSAVLEAGGETVDREGGYTIAALSVYKNDLSDSARMIVMSDGMMTADDAVNTDGYSNKDFLYSLFDKFFGKGDMPYGCRSISYNQSTLEDLTMGQARIYAFILISIPIALAAFGVVVLVRRKNR